MRAWHFLRSDCRLRYGDGRLVAPGVTLRHEGTLKLCATGLHASRTALHALQYAPHEPRLVVSRVECGGTVVEGNDKLVCTERTALWLAPADETLRHFARLCALDVAHRWEAPNVVLRWLRTGDESLREAAGDAAYAAWYAARVAIGAGARDAAWNAAEAVRAARAAIGTARAAIGTAAAALSAARDAAWNAADAAVDAAVVGATTRQQSRRLHRMLMELGRREK